MVPESLPAADSGAMWSLLSALDSTLFGTKVIEVHICREMHHREGTKDGRVVLVNEDRSLNVKFHVTEMLRTGHVSDF